MATNEGLLTFLGAKLGGLQAGRVLRCFGNCGYVFEVDELH